MTPSEFERHKRDEERARRDYERAAGATEQVLARLRREYGCDSPEAARKLTKRLRAEAAVLRGECGRIASEIDREYADKLGA